MSMNIDKKNLNDLHNLFNSLPDLLNPKDLKDSKTLKDSEKFTDYYNSIHPLDKEIRGLLDKIGDKIGINDDQFKIFSLQTEIKELWLKLLEKSIICLRYFDTREPFINSKGKKKPIAYGIEELSDFFENYTDFESALYGSVKYYRDHVMHVFRVWLLGINLLLRGNGEYLKLINIANGYDFSNYEKISMWTIIALTHDLGYPLEKSYKIIDKTNNMMKSFIANPSISMDVSFSGVQNSMNDFVLRFISSKMRERDSNSHKIMDEDIKDEDTSKLRYVARLQPKYYFKFQKSLEHNQHGVLSALIIYKLLLYFLESDYSLNEDYTFDYEDSRQYYIRREILRPIASHTCGDIYQNDALCFSFLLIICDDAQEWGRKNISQLYVNDKTGYEFIDVKMNNLSINSSEISIDDEYQIGDKETLKTLLDSYRKQCMRYRNIFRDGQETSKRNFNFKRHLCIKSSIGPGTTKYNISLEISKDNQTKILIKKDPDGIFEENDVLISIINKVFEDKKKGYQDCVECKCFEIII